MKLQVSSIKTQNLSKSVDEELSQSIARVVILGISNIFLGAYGVLYDVELFVVIAIGSYLLFSITWFIWIKLSPGYYLIRRIAAIVGDLGTLSFFMLQMDSIGIGFYPLYLWIIVGNGMRFGQKYLIFSLVVGIAGFAIVLILSGYWRNNQVAGVGLLIGILILPMFYRSLLNRLHSLNEQLQSELEKSQHSASHDNLTGLKNKHLFFARLQEEIKWSQRNKAQFAVMYLDLDGFKQVNDTCGHQAGDQLLIEVAERLNHIIRGDDVAARLGGDEFSILLRLCSQCEQVEPVLSRLLGDLSKSYSYLKNENIVTASIGICFFPEHGTTIYELISKADFAMYVAKQAGKNRYAFFSNDDHAEKYSIQYESGSQ